MPKQVQYFLGVQKSQAIAILMLAQQAQMALPEGVSGLVICMRLLNSLQPLKIICKTRVQVTYSGSYDSNTICCLKDICLRA